MEIDKFMTAIEFAEKVNTAYPTVAKWLRDGRVPGAFRHKIGNMEIWMIPGDVLKDFVRPKMGRPVLTEEEKAARAKKKATKTTSAGLLFKSATATKPKAKAGQAVKRVAKKGAQKK
jgi:hypothetical protein